MSSILLLKGTQFGILGEREPEIYGRETLVDIEQMVEAEVAEAGWDVISLQREWEGELVGAVHEHLGHDRRRHREPRRPDDRRLESPGCAGGLRSAVDRGAPDEHLGREQFRHDSVLAPLASGVVVGLGALGYRLAAQALVRLREAGDGQL